MPPWTLLPPPFEAILIFHSVDAPAGLAVAGADHRIGSDALEGHLSETSSLAILIRSGGSSTCHTGRFIRASVVPWPSVVPNEPPAEGSRNMSTDPAATRIPLGRGHHKKLSFVSVFLPDVEADLKFQGESARGASQSKRAGVLLQAVYRRHGGRPIGLDYPLPASTHEGAA